MFKRREPENRTSRHPLVAAIVVCLLLASSSAASAEDAQRWGSLSGRFVLDGPRPEPKQIPVTKDKERLPEFVPDESLVVDASTGAVANVLIYLVTSQGEDPPRVHPSYEKSAEANVQWKLRGARFHPHVQLLRTGQSLSIISEDDVIHAPHFNLLQNPPSGIMIRSGALTYQFEYEERLPVPIRCNIHPWMQGHLLIRSNPYMAKTEADGRFQIANLPVGRHTFQLWHERYGYVRNLVIGNARTDRRGRITLRIDRGANPLGKLRLPPPK